MAKTESTAVNALISQVKSGDGGPVREPAADLFSAPAARPARPTPARLTDTVPPLRGAGEVAPLPARRAPHSTSSQQVLPQQVRMSTADPERGNTIPPISRPTAPRPATPRPARRAPTPNPTSRASAPLPPPRQTPRATSQVPVQRASTLPPAIAPVAAPFSAGPTPSAPLGYASVGAPPARSERFEVDHPFAARPAPGAFPVVPRPVTMDITGDVVKADTWFGDTAAIHKADLEQKWVGTSVVMRQREQAALLKKLIAPAIVAAIVGVMVGGYFAVTHGAKHKTAAAALANAPASQHVVLPTAPALAPAATRAAAPETAAAQPTPAGVDQPQPPTKAEDIAKAAVANQAESQAALTHDAPAAAPTPSPAVAPSAPAPSAEVVAAVPPKAVATSGAPAEVREVRTTQGVVKLVDVRIDSKPAGATVMLVDNGKTSFLGSTPLSTSVDPAKKYDVIFTLPGRPTQMTPLDPSQTSKLEVTLDRAHHHHRAPASAAVAEVAAAPKPAKSSKASFADAIEKTETPKPEKADKPEKAEKKVAKDDAAASGDGGTLMVSSKPPCEILIDGKATGLTTPQRSVPLSAGVHKVTFVNESEGIKKTVAVSIKPGQSTKLLQDLMAK